MAGICGLMKTTLLDYPGHIAATIFFRGCSFCCPFCHNGALVMEPFEQPVIEEEEVLNFLNKRKGILQGVCITGGEPLLHKELPVLLEKIKALGYLIKLDTNGYQPKALRTVLNQGMVDYVAMDIKAGARGYARAAGVSVVDMENIYDCINLIMDSGISYEFRTTVARELHQEQDFLSIREMIRGAKAYFLQAYQESEAVICPEFHSYTKKEMEFFANLMNGFVERVEIRGMEDENGCKVNDNML